MEDSTDSLCVVSKSGLFFGIAGLEKYVLQASISLSPDTGSSLNIIWSVAVLEPLCFLTSLKNSCLSRLEADIISFWSVLRCSASSCLCLLLRAFLSFLSCVVFMSVISLGLPAAFHLQNDSLMLFTSGFNEESHDVFRFCGCFLFGGAHSIADLYSISFSRFRISSLTYIPDLRASALEWDRSSVSFSYLCMLTAFQFIFWRAAIIPSSV